jgi:hypothetical protein
MLCSKCHKNEATVHVDCESDGQSQRIDLCEACAPCIGFGSLSIDQLKEFSVLGKNCEFCGKVADSGQIAVGGGVIYWCSGCGTEFTGILSELIESERPDLMQPNFTEGAFGYIADPDLQAWSALATQKAVGMLRERRRGDGRTTGS